MGTCVQQYVIRYRYPPVSSNIAGKFVGAGSFLGIFHQAIPVAISTLELVNLCIV